MIPILYDSTEVSFNTNGLGRLAEATKCIVTEERNGIYECQFQYPVDGKHFSQLVEGRIIGTIHDDRKDIQPFIIYRHSAPLNGLVTFYAHHISYRLGNVVVKPYRAQTVVQALAGFKTNNISDNPFSFWTDKSTVATFTVVVPSSIRELLGGSSGSILDVYGGGEYEWDKWTVKFYQNRGTNSGVTIRYGKNLSEFTQEYDESEVYNAVAPYWRNSEDNTSVYLPEGYVAGGAVQPGEELVIVPLDLTEVWDTAPTVTQLRSEALRRLNGGSPWEANENIKVNFVALWQTEEYKSIAELQRVALCDTVTIIHPKLNVNRTAKVVKVVYDALAERYTRMELGTPRTTLSATIKTATLSAVRRFAVSASVMQAAIDAATELIKGGAGGHFVIGTNADGQPNEAYWMDTDDKSTATNVLRINMNGIGFSRNGFDGPYTNAWTIDGHLNADFIDTGTLNANLLKAGIISDRQGRNYWNLETGEISISIEPGEEGEVTQADLARVEHNAQTYADTAYNNAKDYADDIESALRTTITVTQGDIMASVAGSYATKQEVSSITSGNILLQTPYTKNGSVATFRAVVYKAGVEATNEYLDSQFRWYIKREDYADKNFIGTGKSVSVDTNTAKYGMTVVCEMAVIGEPEYWVDHTGDVISDQDGDPLYFVSKTETIVLETELYQQGYTENRFASLEMTDTEIRAEVGRKINDDEARSLVSQTATQLRTEITTASTNAETNAKNYAHSEITQTASSIRTEISTASTNAENNAKSYAHSEITQTATSINSTVSQKVGKSEVISSINQSAESVDIDASKININGVVSANNRFKVLTDGSMQATNGQFSGNINASAISGSTITGTKVISQNNTRKIEMDASYLRFEDTEAQTKSAQSGWNVDPTAGWITTRNQNATYYNADDGTWEYFVGQYVPCLDILVRNGSDLRIAMASSPTSISRQVMTVHGTDNGRVGFGTPVNMASELFVGGNIHCKNLIATTSVTAHGGKPRAVSTEDYGTRLLYCYETPSPMFGDIGEGIIGEDGTCRIFVDPVFAETVTLDSYQIFLQVYGDGKCYVSERKPGYFVVTGTPGLSFGWELKAKQKDFDQLRFKDYNMMLDESEEKGMTNYGEVGLQHIEDINNERRIGA